MIESKARHTLAALIVAGAAIGLSGCAAHYSPDSVSDPYGLFSGIWHGIVFPLALMTIIVSWLLSWVGVTLLDGIQIIGRPNTGFGYYVGFALGLCFYGGAANS
jgi:hypothetical protein